MNCQKTEWDQARFSSLVYRFAHPPAWLPPPLLPSLVGLVLLLRGWLELEVEGGMAVEWWRRDGGAGLFYPPLEDRTA